jgi:hypothetical protein
MHGTVGSMPLPPRTPARQRARQTPLGWLPLLYDSIDGMGRAGVLRLVVD